jgi:chemotaxis protein MotB
MADKRPIIVIRKKGGHSGHHGGAWKVAYADFVTAMMALFIVLWLMNSSNQIKVAIGGYFKDPSGTSKMVGTDKSGSGDNFIVTKDNMAQLKEQLQKSVRQNTDFEKMKNQIEMTVTAEGLRIELLETERGTFFETGSAEPTVPGRQLLAMLGQQFGKLPNKLSIEGHTDSRQFGATAKYGNWELSTDRANSARRVMEQSGLRPDQVADVRGFADQRLRKKDAPEDASNRRISVIVRYMTKEESDVPPSAAPSSSPETSPSQSHGPEHPSP